MILGPRFLAREVTDGTVVVDQVTSITHVVSDAADVVRLEPLLREHEQDQQERHRVRRDLLILAILWLPRVTRLMAQPPQQLASCLPSGHRCTHGKQCCSGVCRPLGPGFPGQKVCL